MELRHLRYFVAVAEELHFGRAAARLHIAQPPLSQQIRALEGELGGSLFHRTRRRVELTDAGRAFLPEARATLAQAERAREALQEVRTGERGRLAVGFVTSACHTVLPAAVRDFRARYPNVEVTLHEMTPAAQLDALIRRGIDVGLLRPPVDMEGIATEIVLHEPLAVAIPAEHPRAKRKGLRLLDLREEPFILFPRRHGPGLSDVAHEACRGAGFAPRVAHEPNEMQALLAHVASGLGISIVPASIASFHPGAIVYRPLRGTTSCIALVAAWSTTREAAVVRNFRSSVAAEGARCLSRVRCALTAAPPVSGRPD